MKRASLFLFLAVGFVANAQQKQSLKDLLYSGKLRSDSNSVVHREDDLSTKIDTSTRKPAEAETAAKATTTATTGIEPTKTETTSSNTASATTNSSEPATAATTAEAEAAKPVVTKSNTRLWKEYTDSLGKALTTEVLSNKKIKKDTYFIMAEYEIGADGTVNVLNVTSSPENPYLQSEVKSRMELGTPKLAPVLDSAGKPQKVKRKVSFSVTKE